MGDEYKSDITWKAKWPNGVLWARKSLENGGCVGWGWLWWCHHLTLSAMSGSTCCQVCSPCKLSVLVVTELEIYDMVWVVWSMQQAVMLHLLHPKALHEEPPVPAVPSPHHTLQLSAPKPLESHSQALGTPMPTFIHPLPWCPYFFLLKGVKAGAWVPIDVGFLPFRPSRSCISPFISDLVCKGRLWLCSSLWSCDFSILSLRREPDLLMSYWWCHLVVSCHWKGRSFFREPFRCRPESMGSIHSLA